MDFPLERGQRGCLQLDCKPSILNLYKSLEMSSTCCATEEQNHNHSHEGHDHEHDHGDASSFKTYIPAVISFLMLMTGISFDYFDQPEFFQNQTVRFIWYLIAYIPVGFPVFKEAFETMKKGEFFTEFTLMSVATIGAFILGEFPEGVAVMLFLCRWRIVPKCRCQQSKKQHQSIARRPSK